MSSFRRHPERQPQINNFDIGVCARGGEIHRNAQGFSLKVPPQRALRFGRIVEITQGFSLLFKIEHKLIKITQGFTSPGDETVRRA